MKNWFGTSLLVAGLFMAPVMASAQMLPTIAPPAPLAENPPPAPSSAHIWVGGYWNWNGTQYAWTAGRWEQPPQAAQAWAAPQWQRENRVWRFRPGHWRSTNLVPAAAQPVPIPAQPAVGVPVYGQPVVGAPVYAQPTAPVYAQPAPVYGQVAPSYGQAAPAVGVPVAPPRPRFERAPRMYGRGQVWVPGYWSWNGTQHVWTQGHLESAPRMGARWVAPKWTQRGNAWVFTPGTWR